MGKIVTLGKAARLVPYDCLTTTVTFRSSASRTDAALRTVLKESEQFLTLLKDTGIELSGIEAGKNSVWESRTREETCIYASRDVTFRTAYDPGFVDNITRMIADGGFDATLDFSSEVTGIQKVKNELYEDAAQTAKVSAEGVATAMGMKIISLERIKTEDADRYNRNVFGDRESTFDDGMDVPMSLAKSVSVEGGYSELSAPKTKVEVVVYAEWNVE